MQGSDVIAEVRATNSIGEGQPSFVNSAGGQIEVSPHTPELAPMRNVSTSTTENIGIVMPEITGIQTGGSPILSYALYWDQGSGIWTNLTGVGQYHPSRYYTVEGLTNTNLYKFKYKVRNVHGWSDYSPEVELMSAAVPAQMDPPTTEMNEQYLKVKWLASDNGGSEITQYKVEFQLSDKATFI